MKIHFRKVKLITVSIFVCSLLAISFIVPEAIAAGIDTTQL